MTQDKLLRRITEKVATFYGVDADGLYQGGRLMEHMCQVRHVAIYLISQTTQLPDTVVANHFGLDRSSLSDVRKSIYGRLENEHFQEEIDALRSACFADGVPGFLLHFNPEDLVVSAFLHQARREEGPSRRFAVCLSNAWSDLPPSTKDVIRNELQKSRSYGEVNDEDAPAVFQRQGVWGPVRFAWSLNEKEAA